MCCCCFLLLFVIHFFFLLFLHAFDFLSVIFFPPFAVPIFSLHAESKNEQANERTEALHFYSSACRRRCRCRRADSRSLLMLCMVCCCCCCCCSAIPFGLWMWIIVHTRWGLVLVMQVLAAVKFSHLWMFEREARKPIFLRITTVMSIFRTVAVNFSKQNKSKTHRLFLILKFNSV